MNKAIIAIDSFKGCLTSEEAGSAVMEGIKTIFPDCETLLFPIADGGEGMLDILTSATKGKYRTLPAHGPLMELVQGRYGISGDGQTALIEMAAVSGLPLVPEDKRNPMLTTTYGTGELILDALEQGCRHFIVGIGGSATNDAGLGMLQALGFRFLDKRGNLLGTGGRIMSQVASIDTSAVHPALKEARFTMYAIPSAGLTGRLTSSLRKREPIPRWSKNWIPVCRHFHGLSCRLLAKTFRISPEPGQPEEWAEVSLRS